MPAETEGRIFSTLRRIATDARTNHTPTCAANTHRPRTPNYVNSYPACHLLIVNGHSTNRHYSEIDPQPGHVREEINIESLSSVAGEPRHIVADLTAGTSQVPYEVGGMFKLDKCLTKEIGKLTVFALAEVECAITLAIDAG